MERLIIYADLDAFYASVEIKENSELIGKPVIVGGDTDRSVVSACSYEARKYGVHSAMSMIEAKRLCPDAVIIPVNMSLYATYSKKVIEVLNNYSPIVEQISIDEACIDMTDWKIPKLTTPEIAKQLQKDIFTATGLTASIGVASSKGIAKMASDFNKPNGITIIEPGTEAAWLAPQPIRNLRGVGKSAIAKMDKLYIKTIGDFAKLTPTQAERHFGVNGTYMLNLAKGIDDSEVYTFHQQKSIGREQTYTKDQTEREIILQSLLYIAEDISYRLFQKNLLAHGIVLKVRYSDFCTITRSVKFLTPNCTTNIIYNEAVKLFDKVQKRPIRLIGITATPLLKKDAAALNLFDDTDIEKAKRLEKSRQAVIAKFGKKSIIRAALSVDKKEKE